MSLDIVCRCNALRHADIGRALSGWWAHSDSDGGLTGYEPVALTN